MDSEIENLEASAKAIAIISIIPIILYALWADALERSLFEHPQEFDSADRENESNKLKMAHLIIIIFQFSLYLESPLLRQAYPFASQIMLITALSIQWVLHSSTERKLFPKHEHQESLLILSLKIIRSWLIGILICSIFLVLFLQLHFFLVHKLQVLAPLSTFTLILSSTLAMIAGMIMNYALAPFHLLKALPHESLEDHPIKKTVVQLFEKHSLPVPKLWIIKLQQFRFIDLSILGFQSGRWIFQYSLFISQPALQQLNSEELHALLQNEISHILLHHPRKKLLSTGFYWILSTLFAISTGLILIYLIHRPDLADLSSLSVGLTSFLFSFQRLGLKTKQLEFEADVYTLTKLKIPFETWAESLRKLDRIMIHNHPQLSNLLIHKEQALPETEQRIQLLALYLHSISDSDQNQHPDTNKDFYSKAS